MTDVHVASDSRWQRPAGLDEILPPHGARCELLRRPLLDLFSQWGYDLVIPPLVEYLDSLLTGSGSDLDLQTLKLTDFESGRSLGVRADMTPQVARIDAHQLRQVGPTRLCYIGTVLRTKASGLVRTRSPMQVGAELFGHEGVASDVEIVTLMLACLECAEIQPLNLDLGHVGVFKRLVSVAGVDGSQRARLFDALQRKSGADVDRIVAELPSGPYADALRSLAILNGDVSVLDIARAALSRGDAELELALAQLNDIAAGVVARNSRAKVHIDLADLRGYHHHPGVVFAAFTTGYSQEIARGGRYDVVGAAFGRARRDRFQY